MDGQYSVYGFPVTNEQNNARIPLLTRLILYAKTLLTHPYLDTRIKEIDTDENYNNISSIMNCCIMIMMDDDQEARPLRLKSVLVVLMQVLRVRNVSSFFDYLHNEIAGPNDGIEDRAHGFSDALVQFARQMRTHPRRHQLPQILIYAEAALGVRSAIFWDRIADLDAMNARFSDNQLSQSPLPPEASLRLTQATNFTTAFDDNSKTFAAEGSDSDDHDEDSSSETDLRTSITELRDFYTQYTELPYSEEFLKLGGQAFNAILRVVDYLTPDDDVPDSLWQTPLVEDMMQLLKLMILRFYNASTMGPTIANANQVDRPKVRWFFWRTVSEILEDLSYPTVEDDDDGIQGTRAHFENMATRRDFLALMEKIADKFTN